MYVCHFHLIATLSRSSSPLHPPAPRHSASFVALQVQTYKVILYINPSTGVGIQKLFELDWTLVYTQAFLLAFSQAVSFWYFCSRSWNVSPHSSIVCLRIVRTDRGLVGLVVG